MTITIDITPDLHAALARQAAAHGRAIESYVASLLEEAAQLPATRRSRWEAKAEGGIRGRKGIGR